MDLLVFAPLVLVVIAGLAWWWWTGRTDDPAGSVDSFSRALTAMQPASGRPEGTRRDAEEADAPAAR